MKSKINQLTLNALVNETVQKKPVFGAVFYVSSGDRSIDFISAAGNMDVNRPYYIASINKMFISAVALQLLTEQKLELQDKIGVYLAEKIIEGLHVYGDMDYSDDITILHLLSHTSGLPDYLTDKQVNGTVAMHELEAGVDQAWPISRVLREVKKMKPHFPPGEKGKAKYSDTNHHLLGFIIEKIMGMPIQQVLENIFLELNMENTYVFTNKTEPDFSPVYYQSEIRNFPQFLTSTNQDIISTARDQMIFLKAFFSGYFFPKKRLAELEKWNSVFFPFKYGIGVQLFYIPRILTPLKGFPKAIGHAGSTGSLAFYFPEKDIYVTGTINQQAAPQLAFQTMVRIINKL